MSKNCRYCGKPLPEEAAFCPYCARSQLDAQEAPEPPRSPKKPPLLLIPLLAAAALLLCVGWRLSRTPQPIEVPPETSAETTAPPETTLPPETALPPETTAPTTEAETEPTGEAVPAGTTSRWLQGDRIADLYEGLDGYFEYSELNLEGQVIYHLLRSNTGESADVTVYSEDGAQLSSYRTSDVEGALAARGVDLNNLPENRISIPKGFKVIR